MAKFAAPMTAYSRASTNAKSEEQRWFAPGTGREV
jgi:hypothetical protein